MTKKIAKDADLYHGTRWKEGDPQWWLTGDGFPDKVGEDGGISFTLDKDASPKIKNAQVILFYKAIECAKKGDFYKTLQANPDKVCYTKAEEEVVIGIKYLKTYIKYDAFFVNSKA